MHDAAWVLAPLLLVVVLLWSGAAKVGQGSSLRSIISNLRLPGWILPAQLAWAVPWIEVALAAGLLSPWRPAYVVAAVMTLGLMTMYWLLIARGLTLTPRPQCGCFGMAGDHRITWRSLTRNSILVGAAIASVGLAWSGRNAWDLFGDFRRGDWLWLALTTVVISCLVLILGTSSGRPFRERLARVTRGRSAAEAIQDASQGAAGESVPNDTQDDYIRVPIPRVVVVDSGVPRTLHELSALRAQLLIFIDCYCHSSNAVAAEVPGWAERMPAIDVRLVLSMKYDPTTPFGEIENPLLDHAGLGWEALNLTASPSAVLLGADGSLAGGPVAGLDDIREFVADIEAELMGVVPPVSDAPDEAFVARQSSPSSDESQLAGGPSSDESQLTGDR